MDSVLDALLEGHVAEDDERYSEDDIQSVAGALDIDLDGLDLSSLAEAQFIQSAVKRPGQLHRDLGVPQGQKIPHAAIVAAASKPGKVGQRARLALKLKRLARKRKG